MTKIQKPQQMDAYDHDLRSQDHEGETAGSQEHQTRTAYDIKALTRSLHDLPDNVLRQIPVLEPGAQLEEGATYLDLRDPDKGEFTGMNNMVVGPEDWFVPKSETDYELWNRLCNHISPSYRLGRLATVHDREVSNPEA